ncbi:MAG: hypothetical protein M0P73_10380 [Syntrophobacterales bacterium]|jgi:Na+/H+ antiporter NhaD/arsenite permease-like protein|nr:hypothetical protein [Syntrophobacterales bacterium]
MNLAMNPATLIFLLTYILVALGENSPRKLDRPTAALLGAVLMVATGALSRAEARAAIDMSTLAVLFGLMLLLTILLQSGLSHLAGLQGFGPLPQSPKPAGPGSLYRRLWVRLDAQ